MFSLNITKNIHLESLIFPTSSGQIDILPKPDIFFGDLEGHFPYVSPPCEVTNLLPSDLGLPNNPAGWIPPVPKFQLGKYVVRLKSIRVHFPASHVMLPSRELTYPTWGKGKSSSNMPFFWGYVSSLEGNLQKDQRHLPTHRTSWYGSWHLRCYLLLIASVDKEVSTELKLRLPQWHNDVSPNPHGCRWEKLYLEVQDT